MNELSPAEITGDFDIGYINENIKSSYGMHRHKYCELLFVLGGDLNFLVEDKIYHCNGSCMIFFRENRLHTTEINTDVRYERYNLYFRQKYISEIVPFDLIRKVYDNDCLVIPLNEDEKNDMRVFFEQMYSLRGRINDHSLDGALNTHLLCAVLLKTAALVEEKFDPESCHIDSYIAEVLSYINENLSSKLVIEDIADVFYVSRAKLINDFKRTTGVTIGDYILSRRIKISKQLINSGHKIGEVAEMSGFTNACHFIRTFKKVTGQTPLQYRTHHVK